MIKIFEIEKVVWTAVAMAKVVSTFVDQQVRQQVAYEK